MIWRRLIIAVLAAAAGGAVAALLRLRERNGSPRPEDRTTPGFVANPETGVFHRIDCRAARSLTGTPVFTSAEDAILEGYRPCGLCKP